MAQNDFVIADQGAVAALADINSALQALASCSSGASEPATKYANQLWYDTTANILKLRNEANSAWISIGYFDQSANAFRILDNTQVVNTSGTQTGLLGDQSTSAWQSGTGSTESLVSPAKVKAAIDAALAAGGYAPIQPSGLTFPVGSYVFGIASNYGSTNPGDTFSAASSPITVYGGTAQNTINTGTWKHLGREGGNTILYQRIA